MSSRIGFFKKLAAMPECSSQAEVMEWLAKQPESMDWLFDVALESKGIIYDEAAGKWRGAVTAEVGFGPPYSAEQMLAVMKGDALKFTDWHYRCEQKYGWRVGKWSFVRSIHPLLDTGKIAKEGKSYVRLFTAEETAAMRKA